jgi:hypothetical protein
VTVGRTPEARQAYAVARSMERRRADLAPTRAEIAELIDRVGWRRARPLIHEALGRPVRRAGLWQLGKRDANRVLAALREGPKGQQSLFDRKGEQR